MRFSLQQTVRVKQLYFDVCLAIAVPFSDDIW